MSILAQRQAAMLEAALGSLVEQALTTPGTVEILVNPDGTIWHERFGQPTVCIGQQPRGQTEAVLRLVATMNGREVHAGRPSLAGVLPGGQRFQGFLPPRTTGPAYCIRCPQSQVLPREAYVPACCTASQWDVLEAAVIAGETVLLAGGMSSGKSTLLNSLVALIPQEIRVVTMEDVAELLPQQPNHLQLYATGLEDLAAVVKDGFRTAAQRIPVGEIRDGATALQALKLWLAVGGGLATIHADSARQALARLSYLCEEGGKAGADREIATVVKMVVYLAKTAEGVRVVRDVLRITGWENGQYVVEAVR